VANISGEEMDACPDDGSVLGHVLIGGVNDSAAASPCCGRSICFAL
jgi:hypothetical protein